jgi:hypothetical protein
MSSIRAFTIGLAVLSASWAQPARAENHRQYADSKPEECAECHRGSGVMENHGAAFLRDHRVIAKKTPNNCSDCHLQSWCADCHHGGNLDHPQTSSLSRRGESMPETHAADFISTHAIKATDDPQSCTRCHDSPKFCSDCHTRQIAQNRAGMAIKPHAPYFSGGAPDPNWVATHRADARRNLQSCQGCHPNKSDCSNFACHPSLGGR